MQPATLLSSFLFLCTIFKGGHSASCSERCSGISTRFNFKQGSSYSYNYQSSTKVQLVGGSDKAGVVGLQAKATISVLGPCEYLLQLSDVKFNGPPAAQVGFDLAQELSKNALPFSYDNGAVRHICPSAQENNDALNVKRGILSTFQLSNDFDAEDAYEEDVSGNCPVVNQVRQEGDAKVITETKNLLACRNHVYNYTSFRLIPYNVASKIQNVPALNASQICIYRVQQGILKEASCREKHDLLAFRSQTGGGISSNIESKLTYAADGKAAAAVAPGPKKSILFNEQPFIYRESKEAAGRARNLIKTLQDTAANEARPESPGIFQELVHVLKAMSAQDLRVLAQEAKAAGAQNSKTKRVFVDAIGQCGAPSCVQVLVELLTPKKNPNVPELSNIERRLLLVNLALTPHPTEAGVAAITAALDGLPDQGLFSASAFVNNYVRQHQDGQNNNEVKKFIQVYLSTLSKMMPSNTQSANAKLIEALRALGNLENIKEGINERLAYLDKDAPIDVKLAAIQSLRRAPCVPASQNKLFQIFADEKISVEIRLNAFLVLTRQCASRELVGKLVNYTSSENKLNQIGSFVQSYFNSYRASKDPSKDKNPFARSFLKKKFPSDGDRYSSFSEYSSFNYKKNLGYHVDLSTIYVPQDAYPRQESVNVTLDLWGSEVNILELGFRNDHLHDVADNMFGPEGYFSESLLARDRDARRKQNAPEKNPKLAEYQAAFDAKHKLATGLDISAYIRLFGDEIAYAGAYDVNIVQKSKETINPPAILSLLSKEQTGSFYVHRLPYDSFVTIPVISGFPLRLASNGSIVLNIEASSKADIKKPAESIDVRLKLKPSAAYTASCHMAVYTGSVKNGVQYKRTSHSATAVELQFSLKNRDQLSAKVIMPKPRQEIYSVHTNVYTIVNDNPIKELGVAANRGEGKFCAPTVLNQYTGLKFCAEISYPNASYVKESPYFPLTGPFRTHVFLDKEDPEISSYEITASWKPNPTGRDVIVKYDVPKSKTNRGRSLTVNYVRQKSINLDFNSPKNKITAKGTLEGAGPDQTGAKISTNINGKTYDFVGKFIRSTKPDNYRKYDFDGEVKTADVPKAGNLKGSLELQPGRKVNLDATLADLYDKPITMKARYEKAGSKYSVEYDYRGLAGPRRLAGDVNMRSPADMDYKFESEYVQQASQKVHKVSYEHKHSVSLAPKNAKVTSSSKITSSLYPAANMAYDVVYERQPDKINLKASTVEGGHEGINIEAIAKTQPNNYDISGHIKYSPAKIHQKVIAVYRQDAARGYEASLTYTNVPTNQETKASVTAKGKSVEGPVRFTGDVSAVLKLPGAGGEYKVDGSVKQSGSSDEYTAVITAQLPQNRKAEIKSTLKGKYGDFERKDIVSLPNSDPIEIIEKIKYINSEYAYAFDLKKKGASLINFDSNINRKDPSKNSVKFRIQAPQQQIDYAFDGVYQPSTPNQPYRVSGTVNKNNKPYLKNDIAIPSSFKPDQNKEARFYVTYDLGQQPEKSVKIDYKTDRQGQAVDHNAVVDINLPNADYKFDFKRRHNEACANNLTIYRQDKPIIQVNVGRLQRQAQAGYFDVNVKTFAPYQPRDLAGRLSFETSPQKYKGDLYLADQAQNQKIGVSIEANKVSGGYDKKLNVRANEMEVEVKNKYIAQPNDAGLEVNGAASVKMAPNQPQNYKWSYSSAQSKIEASVETPVPNFEKASFKVLRGQQGSQKTLKYDIVLGKQTANIDTKYDYSDKNILLDVGLKSSLDALKNIQYSVTSDQRSGLDAGFNVNVNNLHKLSSFYKLTSAPNGDQKYGIGFSAKLGNAYDWEVSSDSLWNDKAGKYVTKNTVKTSPQNKYRVDVDMDANTNQAKVDLENIPGIKSPVKGKVKKVAESEYEITLEDATGPNKGLVGFKFTAPSQKLRLETAAFKSSIESEYTATKFSVATRLIPDPAAPNKAYGLKYATEAPNEFSRSANLEVTYPERTLGISSKRTRQPNAKLDQTLEISHNVGKCQPVKIQYGYAKTPGAKTSCELHLTDQSIPDGLHLTADFTKSGNIDNDNADYAINSEIQLKYSNNPQQHLLIKKENKRQVINQRSKVTSSIQLQHQTSNLNHKIFNTYLLEPCDSGAQDCEYAFVLGTSYPTPQKTVEEISIDIKRTQQQFNAIFASGKDKYKITRKQVKGQRSYSYSKNDQDLYDINTELITQGQPSAAISIVEKARNAVLLRASASLQGNDLATVQVLHDQNGQLVKDIDASIKLAASNLLKIKYFRRPGLAEAVNSYVKQLPSPKNAINLPVVQSHSAIGKEIAEKLKPFFAAMDKEDNAIASELQFTSGKLSNALKEQSENIGEAFNFAVDSVSSYSAAAANAFSNITKSYGSAAREFVGRLPNFNQNVVVPLRNSLASAGQKSSDLFNRGSQAVNEAYSGSKLNDLVNKASKLYREAGPGSPYQKMVNIYKKLQPASSDDKGPGYLGTLNRIRQERAKDLVTLWYQVRPSLAANSDYKEMAEFFDQVVAKIQWYYSYVDPSLPSGSQPGSKGWAWFQKPDIAYEGFSYNASTDPASKAVSASITLPLLRDYNSLKDLAQALTPERLADRALQLQHQAEDYLDKIFGVDSGLPDGESRGLVVGQQYIVTFDGQARIVSSNCKYLLAKDYIDQLFSVQLEYVKSGNQIIVQYRDDTVVLTVDGNTKINGKNSELPYQVRDQQNRAKLTVTKHDEFFTHVNLYNGLDIECDSYNKLCIIKVQDRFRGRTNGLLGRNDGEPYTDLLLPNETPAANFDAYLQAWALDSKCASSKNAPLLSEIPASHPAFADCKRLFKGRARCPRVDQESFYKLCLNSAQRYVEQVRDANKQNQSTCVSSSAYLSACPAAGEPQAQCVQCSIPGGRLEQGDAHEINERPNLNQVDVLFVVDNSNCLEKAIKGRLGPLAQKIEASVKQAGQDVKFGLAGFNGLGDYPEPAFYTSSGAVTFSAGGLQAAASNLQFPDPLLMKKQKPLNVLAHVIEHHAFRPASRKVLVLFSCKNCASLEFGYDTLHNDIFEQNIALHLVTSNPISMSSPPKGAAIIGFDAKALIATSGARNTAARSELSEPSDSCTILAQESNGTVFSVANGENVDSVFNALAIEVGRTAQRNPCQKCTCEAYDNYPWANCVPCEIPQPTEITSDKTGFIRNPIKTVKKYVVD